MDKRQELTRKAWQEKAVVMGYHDSHHPLFRLTDYNEGKGYMIKSIDEKE
jgi:hypothetical protein